MNRAELERYIAEIYSTQGFSPSVLYTSAI